MRASSGFGGGTGSETPVHDVDRYLPRCGTIALRLGALWLLVGCAPGTDAGSDGRTPAHAVAELLAADREFSQASGQTDLISGLSAMFAPDVMMPAPGERIARGVEDVLSVLRTNPANAGSRAEWTPI